MSRVNVDAAGQCFIWICLFFLVIGDPCTQTSDCPSHAECKNKICSCGTGYTAENGLCLFGTYISRHWCWYMHKKHTFSLAKINRLISMYFVMLRLQTVFLPLLSEIRCIFSRLTNLSSVWSYSVCYSRNTYFFILKILLFLSIAYLYLKEFSCGQQIHYSLFFILKKYRCRNQLHKENGMCFKRWLWC